MTNPKITAELENIAEQNGGVLRAQDVVEASRDPQSNLHSQFVWDDDKAADQWRLQQARQLIRATVRWIEVGGQKEQVNVFVSLSPDRNDGGGYRALVHVLASDSLREQLLLDALAELQLFQAKYARLTELSAIFDAAKKVQQQVSVASAAA